MKKRLPLVLLMLTGVCSANEPHAACSGEPDDRLRLACYDKTLGRQQGTSVPAPVEAKNQESGPGPADSEKPTKSAMSTFWELGENDKRRDFVVRTYHPNFLLPLHYSNRMNRSPSSPSQPGNVSNPDYRDIEAKLQISLRAKIVEDFLLPGADLWVAYTQRSLWQLWDTKDSSPFRSTDYQPEVIYIVPVPQKMGELPFGWNFRMLQLGAAHQSNGQSDPLSRSWNRVYLGAGFEHGDFSLMLRANQRLSVREKDDNPGLVDFIGRGEVAMAWSQGPSTFGLTWRTNLNATSRGSLQLDWTYPVFAAQPSGLRWYAQVFSGYGETLLDYNHRQTSIGVGLALFQF